ncbi:MAG: hypothetical protein ACRDNF_17355 [Streptosporangiaceae bacterium]
MLHARRILLAAGAAGMLAGLIPAAAPATAAAATTTVTNVTYGQIPSDCSLATVSAQSMSLTCTDRPSGQEWSFLITCRGAAAFFVHGFGNQVTGDGKSTATCIEGTASVPASFEIYSS